MQRRVPFRVDHPGRHGGAFAGSVARVHLPALAGWAQDVHIDRQGVRLAVEPPDRQRVLAELNSSLADRGRIVAWRNEPYPLLDDTGELLTIIERAAARFWGSLTFGAHCNGYVADRHGRPTHLWIARRALDKPTDPGRLDNLVGGGVPHGQTPRQALLREAWEEAGLQPAQLRGLQRGGVYELQRDVPEGLQREWLFVYDLALPESCKPVNQDGEVEELRLVPVERAIRLARQGEMTVDAALTTLDFAVRHRLLPAEECADCAAALDLLRVPESAALRRDPADRDDCTVAATPPSTVENAANEPMHHGPARQASRQDSA